MKLLTYGDLCAGIGGFSLGLEAAGMRCRYLFEIDPDLQAFLRTRFDAPVFGDVADLPSLHASGALPLVDVLAFGFPCVSFSRSNVVASAKEQDVSGRVLAKCLDAVAAIRPRFVVAESAPDPRQVLWVPDLRRRLADLGYDSVCLYLSCGSFGLPHRHPRSFVVADSDPHGQSLLTLYDRASKLRPLPVDFAAWERFAESCAAAAAARIVGGHDGLSDRLDREEIEIDEPVERYPLAARTVLRRDDRKFRLSGLGNSVSPFVAEFIGKALCESAGTLDQDARKYARRRT